MEKLLQTLKQEEAYLIKDLAMALRRVGLWNDNLSTSNVLALSSKAFEVFLDAIEFQDTNSIKNSIQKLNEQCLNLGVPPWVGIKVLSCIRCLLYNLLFAKFQEDELSFMLEHVNKAIDRMMLFSKSFFKEPEIFYTSSCCEKFEEIKKNYHILFEKISDGCFINQGGKIVFANRAFCQMHGYEYDEIIGMPCQLLLSEDSRDFTMERFRKQLRGEIPYDSYCYIRQDKQGNKFYTENRAKFIQYNCKPAILGLCTDITTRVKLEEEIKQKEALSLIGKLTTSIAHEIRNRLSAINIDLQILQDNLTLEGNDQRRLEIVHEQFKNLGDFVSQMMEISSTLKLDYHVVSIEELINVLISTYENRFKKDNITVIKNVPPDLPFIMADKKKLLEALGNVLINAFDSFSISNECNFSDKKIEFDAKKIYFDNRPHIDLSISDNGCGIDPIDTNEIFAPFFTKGKKNGIGLGLSIAKRIIDAHHGFIQVDSDKSKGTTFSFLLSVDIS